MNRILFRAEGQEAQFCDREVDLRDFRATLAHLLARTRPETDLFVFANLSMDTLDYTGPEVNEGSKGVWLGPGDPVRELPRGAVRISFGLRFEVERSSKPACVADVNYVYFP